MDCTRSASSQRGKVERLFARDSTARAVALCSDALSEGLNLQGAGERSRIPAPPTATASERTPFPAWSNG